MTLEERFIKANNDWLENPNPVTWAKRLKVGDAYQKYRVRKEQKLDSKLITATAKMFGRGNPVDLIEFMRSYIKGDLLEARAVAIINDRRFSAEVKMAVKLAFL